MGQSSLPSGSSSLKTSSAQYDPGQPQTKQGPYWSALSCGSNMSLEHALERAGPHLAIHRHAHARDWFND